MKFYELDSTRYGRYLNVVTDFERKYKIKNSGVLLIAIENLVEIHEKLLKLDTPIYDFSQLEIRMILKEYDEINYAYNLYFEQIFERCCGYEPVKGDLNFYLGSIYKWTEVVLNIYESTYEEYYIMTEGKSTRECEKIYSQIIRLGDQNLETLIERVYRNYNN